MWAAYAVWIACMVQFVHVLFLWAVLGALCSVCVGVSVHAACVTCMCAPGTVCTPTPHRYGSTLLSVPPQSSPPPTPWGVHTNSLAVLRQRVHLVARVALALKVALVIDTDLAAGVWILALIYVCGEAQRSDWQELCLCLGV